MTWRSSLKKSVGFTLAVFSFLSSLVMILTLFLAWINLSSSNPNDLIFIIVSFLGIVLLWGVASFQLSTMGQHLILSLALTSLSIGSWIACWKIPNISNLLH